MTTLNSTPPSSDWRRWFALLLAAAITASIVLCATACSATRSSTTHTTQQSQQATTAMLHARMDSTARETRVVNLQPVKADTARLTFSMQSLRELPPEASITERQGRASVKVSRQGERILVYASCDSLQRLVEFYSTAYNAEHTRLHKMDSIATKAIQLAKKETKRHKPPALLGFLFALPLVLGGAALLYHFRNRIKLLFL